MWNMLWVFIMSKVAFIFSALYNFLTAVNARNISAFTAVWFPWMLSSLFLLLYIVFKQGLKSFWRSSVNHKGLIVATGIIDTAAWLFYAFAISREDISIITAIVAGYAVIAIILGVKFNGERLSYWQLFGMFLVLFGVMMISLFIN